MFVWLLDSYTRYLIERFLANRVNLSPELIFNGDGSVARLRWICNHAVSAAYGSADRAKLRKTGWVMGSRIGEVVLWTLQRKPTLGFVGRHEMEIVLTEPMAAPDTWADERVGRPSPRPCDDGDDGKSEK